MKKIIPFKKNLNFKTNLAEIVSISLEHEIKIEAREVKGNFIISGSYKIDVTSVNAESFYYDLPFTIELDEKYDLTHLTTDIDDFYYEIINNNILSVNIDVALDHLEEIEVEEVIDKDEKVQNDERSSEIVELPLEKRCIEEETLPPVERKETNFSTVLTNLDMDQETYKSYRVLIIREGDTLEEILKKYQITKEELEAYNDLSEWKVMNKIIIPYNDVES